MTNPFYTATGNPASGAEGLSSLMRGEFLLIQTAFDHMPAFTTTGLFSTTFNQLGNFTFTLPSADATLATTANVTTETARATTAETVLATSLGTETAARVAADTAETAARVAADAAETTRATTAEALLAPKASPALTGTPTAPTAAAGASTTQLATTAFTTAAVSTALNDVGRNRLHNGSMEIVQRGPGVFSVTTGNSLYTADRWIVFASGFTASASIVTGTGLNSRSALQITGSVPSGGFFGVSQRMESADCYDLVGKQVTLSFNTNYSLTGAGSMTFVAVIYAANAKDNFSTFTQLSSVAFVPTGAAATYAITFPATLTSQAANGLLVYIQGTQAGGTGGLGFNITSLQLEPGTIVTPFDRRPVGVDMLLCQRFYRSGLFQSWGYALAGNVWGSTVPFQVPMRAAPTIALPTPTLINLPSISSASFVQDITVYGTATATAQTYINVIYTATSDL